MTSRKALLALLLIVILALAACNDQTVPTRQSTAAAPTLAASLIPDGSDGGPAGAPATPTPAATATPTPTPTPTAPLAALVNGRPVLLADYGRELARYEQAQAQLGQAADPNNQSVVLDALIERELIVQAAATSGISVTADLVDARLVELEAASGGAENFAAWLQANLYTPEEFRRALAAEMIIEQVVVMVTADVPTAAEQLHARYIQVDDPALAQSLLDQARAGADFAALAQQHSLDTATASTGGDLGYFARGSLLVPEVEAAAFALQPGELSEVIAAPSPGGNSTAYYIVLVIEKDPQRELSATMRYHLLQADFEAWLQEQWNQATIERLVADE